MIKLKTSELIGLKRVEIPKHPLKAGALGELVLAMVELGAFLLAKRKGVRKCSSPKDTSLNILCAV